MKCYYTILSSVVGIKTLNRSIGNRSISFAESILEIDTGDSLFEADTSSSEK